jgi:hypothetical protein
MTHIWYGPSRCQLSALIGSEVFGPHNSLTPLYIHIHIHFILHFRNLPWHYLIHYRYTVQYIMHIFLLSVSMYDSSTPREWASTPPRYSPWGFVIFYHYYSRWGYSQGSTADKGIPANHRGPRPRLWLAQEKYPGKKAEAVSHNCLACGSTGASKHSALSGSRKVTNLLASRRTRMPPRGGLSFLFFPRRAQEEHLTSKPF